MRAFASLFFLGLSLAAPVENRPQADHPAVQPLTYTATQLQLVVAELNNYPGKDSKMADQIIRHAQETLRTLDVAVKAVRDGPTFDLWNTLSVASPLTSLDYQVHQLANALKSKKDMIDRERISPVVYTLLKQTYNSASDLTKGVVEKLPVGVSALVGVLSAEIVSTLGTIRDLYRPENDVTIIIADPNHPVSGGYQVAPAGYQQPQYQPPQGQNPQQQYQPQQQSPYQPQPAGYNPQGPYQPQQQQPQQQSGPQPPPWYRANPSATTNRQNTDGNNNGGNEQSPQTQPTPPPGYSWFKANLDRSAN